MQLFVNFVLYYRQSLDTVISGFVWNVSYLYTSCDNSHVTRCTTFQALWFPLLDTVLASQRKVDQSHAEGLCKTSL